MGREKGREAIFAGINFRKLSFTKDLAGIDFCKLGLTKDFRGINFRKRKLCKHFEGINFTFTLRKTFSTTLVYGSENDLSKNYYFFT